MEEVDMSIEQEVNNREDLRAGGRVRPVVALAVLALLLAACTAGTGNVTPNTVAPGDSAVATSPTTTPVPSQGGVVSIEEAEQAALAAVGEGAVTWIGPEDDRGAAWEVEVTRPNGVEVDVLVAADGTVVGQTERVLSGLVPDSDGVEVVPAPGAVVSAEEAAAAALAAVGEGTVTWIGPEDDRGAAWEVEVTRPSGREVDVLVAADGTVIP